MTKRLSSDVADYVLGFETDSANVNVQMNEVAQAMPIGWYGSRLWQFCLLTALDYDPQSIGKDTDDRHNALMERTSAIVIPRLEVQRTKKTAFGLRNKKVMLTPHEIAAEFDVLLNDLTEEFRDRLTLFAKDGVAPRTTSFQLKSDDPTIGTIALAIETVLCRKYGFVLGGLAATNLHGLARMYLRMGPTSE